MSLSPADGPLGPRLLGTGRDFTYQTGTNPAMQSNIHRVLAGECSVAFEDGESRIELPGPVYAVVTSEKRREPLVATVTESRSDVARFVQ